MRNGWAIASFVIGCISVLGFAWFLLLPFVDVLPLAGVALGLIGLHRWRALRGRVFAHLGLWFCVAMLALSLLGWSRYLLH